MKRNFLNDTDIHGKVNFCYMKISLLLVIEAYTNHELIFFLEIVEILRIVKLKSLRKTYFLH